MISTNSAVFLLTAVLFACLSYGHIPDGDDRSITVLSTGSIDTDSEEEPHVEIFVGDEVTVNLTIVGPLAASEYLVRSGAERVFSAEVVSHPGGDLVPLNETFQVKVTGKFLGIESLEFVEPGTDRVAGTYPVRVKRVLNVINSLFTYTLLVWLIVSYVSMGALINWETLKARLYPPWAIIIGMVCQFILMPLVTFILANVLPVDNPTSVGIVLVGTCPGGWLSNIFSVLLDVDFILSITMTFFSSIAGMAMMPLNIFIYATPFIQGNRNLQTPFADLALNLILLVVACLIGIGLGWKFEKFRTFCEKVLKPVAVGLIVFGLGLGIPADIHMFQSEWPIWVAAFTTPLIGAYLGLSLARIFATSIKKSVTIALETGVQNALLARTVVFLYYPQPEGDLVGRVQTLTVLITLVEGCIIAVTYQLVRVVCCRGKSAEDDTKGGETDGRDKSDAVKDGGIANDAFDSPKV